MVRGAVSMAPVFEFFCSRSVHPRPLHTAANRLQPMTFGRTQKAWWRAPVPHHAPMMTAGGCSSILFHTTSCLWCRSQGHSRSKRRRSAGSAETGFSATGFAEGLCLWRLCPRRRSHHGNRTAPAAPCCIRPWDSISAHGFSSILLQTTISARSMNSSGVTVRRIRFRPRHGNTIR